MNAQFVSTLTRRCISCLADGRGTRLWLLRAGMYFVAYCPECDGTFDTGDTVVSVDDLSTNDSGASAHGGA